MYKSIGYHTRLAGNHTVRCCGGSFGGSLDLETVNRLVSAQFTVSINPSGRAVFIDQQGREVSLYISVDPDATIAGCDAIVAWRKNKNAQQAAMEEKAKAEQAELDTLLDGLTHDEIVRKLKA